LTNKTKNDREEQTTKSGCTGCNVGTRNIPAIEKTKNITKNTLKNKDSIRSQMNTPLKERNSIENSNHELNDYIESKQGKSTDDDRPEKRREPRKERSECVSNSNHRERTTLRMMITTARTATRPTKERKARGK
jgi:hypothetical protein